LRPPHRQILLRRGPRSQKLTSGRCLRALQCNRRSELGGVAEIHDLTGSSKAIDDDRIAQKALNMSSTAQRNRQNRLLMD
jgi:hypothetical protein